MAPWWEGMFQCLIRFAKRCLIKGMIKMKLANEEHTTVTTETEDTLNNHPLQYTYDNELQNDLTRTQLHCGRIFLDEPNCLTNDEQIPEILDSEVSVKRWYKIHIPLQGKPLFLFGLKCNKDSGV